MELERIREAWKNETVDKSSSIQLWDDMADQYSSQKIPTFDNDFFLKLLLHENMLSPSVDALDIGCGIANYAIAISPKVNSVVGIDMSSGMINRGYENIRDGGIKNIELIKADWDEFDLDKHGYRGKFDLVFAHMTPAVSHAEAFEKLMAAGSRFCVYCASAHRTDPVSDQIKKRIGITDKSERAVNNIRYAFEILWQYGCLPKLEYEKREWPMRKTLEQAYRFYTNRVKTYKNIKPDEEEMIREYIRSISCGGYVEEIISSTAAALYWKNI